MYISSNANIGRNIKILKFMRKNPDFYCNFQKLNELILGLPFDEDVTSEQKQKAFHSLVNLLVKKGIYKNDGSVQKWRENSLQYLKESIYYK